MAGGAGISPAYVNSIYDRHAFEFELQLVKSLIWPGYEFRTLEVQVMGRKTQPDVGSHRAIPVGFPGIINIGEPALQFFAPVRERKLSFQHRALSCGVWINQQPSGGRESHVTRPAFASRVEADVRRYGPLRGR